MVADTKKRGRPKSPQRIATDIYFPEMEVRTASNLIFAMKAIDTIGMRKDSFFVTQRGNVRRQGIAEQIGRMLEAELITVEEARELAETCMKDYEDGTPVKEIESTLRLLRQYLANGGCLDGD